MILTITPNSALDRILFLEAFQPGSTMRASQMIESVGGKGFDTSVVLQTLGVKNIALGFVAGSTGRQLVKLLDRYGIQHDLTWVEGETRLSHVLVERQHHRHSHVIAGSYTVSPAAYQQFLDRYQAHLGSATWMTAGGTLPAGLPGSCYRHLVELAQAAGVSALVDSAGLPLQAALSARPAILKMNRAEFSQTFGCQPHTFAELKDQAQAVYEQARLPALVLTLGAEGILALIPEGVYLAAGPVQAAVNAAGAGDAVSAALTWRLSAGDPWPEALRWAAATSGATVLTEGTADCHIADIERLWPQTHVQRL